VDNPETPMTFTRLVASCLITAACAFATPSFAQSVKIGLILPMTGPFTSAALCLQQAAAERAASLGTGRHAA